MDKILTNFLKFFNDAWNKTLSELPFKQIQLTIGNKIRPQLVLWGYLFGQKDFIISEIKLKEIAQMAVSVELIHKASVILDDWIDGDMRRHGEAACHVELGVPQSVLFSLNMLSKSLIVVKDFFQNKDFFIDSIYYLLDIIYKMSLGAIKELQAQNDLCIKKQVQEIIDLETAALISNSLLIGYRMNINYLHYNAEIIKRVGDNCGYVFQILNDSEPFCNIEKSKCYKGTVNFDFINGKKNIIYPILLNVISSKDLKILRNAKDENTIITLFNKYKIVNFIDEEINQLYEQINDDLQLLEYNNCSKTILKGFRIFCNDLKKKFTDRLI